jgi:type VI secretion system secreted protein Hcp
MKSIRDIIRRPFVWICIASVYALPLFTLNGAVDMFLKLNGIEGESTDSVHGKEIDVLAWSWGASNSGTTHTGGGGGAGVVNVQDLSLTKYVDKASPALLLRVMNGAHIPDATLVVRKAGSTPVEYIKILMTEVLVTSISMGGSGGEDRLTENVSLNFAKVEFAYSYVDAGGKTIAVTPTKWDIATNTTY